MVSALIAALLAAAELAPPVRVLLLTPVRAAPPEVHQLSAELGRLLRKHPRLTLVSDRLEDGEPPVASEWAIEVTAPGTLYYRSLGGPDRRGHLTGEAAELLAAFEGIALPPAPIPMGPPDFEVTAGLSVGSGEGLDGQLAGGPRFQLSPRWALAADGRAQFGATRLLYYWGLGPPVLAATRYAAFALLAGLRFMVWAGQASCVTLSLSGGAGFWLVSRLQPFPGNGFSASSAGPTTPSIGGVFGVTWRRPLTARWTLVAVLDYSLQAAFSGVYVRRKMGFSDFDVSVNAELFRHEVSLRAGLWL